MSRETLRCIRKREGLRVVKTTRQRRLYGGVRPRRIRAAHPNHVWSYDFDHDETTDERRLDVPDDPR